MDDAPIVYSKTGEFQMPQDIWDTAKELVEALAGLADNPMFADANPDALARTILATALYAERSGMKRPKN